MPTSLEHTDPTYLRTILDGLLSGALHKENASVLPQGLVGMYKEAIVHLINQRDDKKESWISFSTGRIMRPEISEM